MAHLPLRAWLLVGPPADLFSLVLLAMLTSSFSTISAVTVKALGLCEILHTNLVVSPETCAAIGALPGFIRCEPLAEKATAGVILGVSVLSRIGAQMVVEKRMPADPQAPPGRLVLRKDAVLMWAPADGRGDERLEGWARHGKLHVASEWPSPLATGVGRQGACFLDR